MSNPDQSPSFERMFHAAVLDLAAINEALDLDPDDGGADPILEAIAELKARVAPTEAAAMAATVPAVDREALADLIAEHLRDTYHCTRVWGAWGCGTMGEGDFEPVDESDTPAELADAIIAKLAPQPLTDEQIKAAIHGAVKSGRLSWMGYEKDEAGQYTVPVLSPSHYQLARAIEAAKQAPVADQPAEPSPAAMALVYDVFHIGKRARDIGTLLVNAENAMRRSSILSRIENEFFTVSTTEKDENGDPIEECLLNWGHDPDQYIETFRQVLASIQAAPKGDSNG